MKVELDQPTEADIQALLADLLPADRVEITALGMDPEYAIRYSIEESLEVYVVRGDGRVGSIFGIVEPGVATPARPWMLSTTAILDRPKEVLKISRLIYEDWLRRYGYMSNHVDQRHTRAVHWLRWLGARFTPEPKFGPFNRPFFLFEFGEP